ncbi:NfeD-like protein [Fischerella thermalis WC542]|uniref:NfeD family protein n=1 Tax=Fischerella thermalis TaxID=372787 RepID=UPI000C7FA747|nr:NfeD family protein [Fischerella thermalis]PLZ29684.1 NfeD-like protein [Fischerella thermalis WC559]PLZ36288.1 NfeD-like protein [Fischerella thermalis WC542]
MKNSILIITGIAVALGILAGAFIVVLIFLQRRRLAVDSLVRTNNIVGCYGTVEIPLNRSSPGKIRVNLKGSLVDFVALTDETQQFHQGDRVVVVRMKGNKVWVVGV